MKKFKYITIKQVDKETFNGHPVYRIFNNRTQAQLGILSFYKPWKEYVFSSPLTLCGRWRDFVQDKNVHEILELFKIP